MARLPAHHVARPRLVERILAAPFALVEAGGGYGKSVLAGEVRAHVDVAVVELVLAARHADPEVFAGSLARATRQAGYLPTEVHGDDVDHVDAVIGALRALEVPVWILIDEVQHAAAGPLVRFAEHCPQQHRIVLFGRRLPAGAERLRHLAGAAALGATELALDLDETRALLRSGFGVELADRELVGVHGATAGWAAATVAAALRLARSDDPPRLAAELAAAGASFGELVDDALLALTPAQREVAQQVAHLPTFSVGLCARLGADDLVGALVDAGVPVTVSTDGLAEFPGPVAEVLAAKAPIAEATATAGAAWFVEHGQPVVALHLLLDAGRDADVAATLATLSSDRVAAIGFAELAAIVDRLDDAAIATTPKVLLLVAQEAVPAGRLTRRNAHLARLRALLADGSDPRLARLADAEQAWTLVRDGALDEAAVIAHAVLDAASPDELSARARALDVLGQVAAWGYTEAATREAQRRLRESAELHQAAGEPELAGQVLMALGYMVHFTAGRHDEAIRTLEESLSLVNRHERRAVAMAFLLEVFVHAGRDVEASTVAADIFELGHLRRDTRSIAYAHWEIARLASARGDVASLVRALRSVEAHAGEWYDSHTGAYFLADAAMLLDRVGEAVLSREYLQRAASRRAEAPDSLAQVEAVIEARSGDPRVALVAFDAAAELGPAEPREQWRLALLRAFAAWRAGEPDAGVQAAAAFEAAAALGAPDLPLVHERDVANALADLAAEAGSLAAKAVATGRLPVAIVTLGRFEVRIGGRAESLAPGLPTRLVQFLAAAGGRTHQEAAIEALWPDADPERGRANLRKVLFRLGSAVVPVVRDGDALMLPVDVAVDARDFEHDARRALAARGEAAVGGPALARAALARYGGHFLPDEPYEEWAAIPRERLRRLALALLDLLARDAERRGDVDEAVRLIDRAIAEEPDDEERYLWAARLLTDADRPGPAMAFLRRAAAASEALGLTPSPEHARLTARNQRRR